MSFGEMIRHVWSSTFYYHMILKNNGSINDIHFPYDDEPITCVKKEIELAQSCFVDFIEYVQSISIAELDARLIDRSDVGYQRYLGGPCRSIFTIFTNGRFGKTIDLGLNSVIIYKGSKLALR